MNLNEPAFLVLVFIAMFLVGWWLLGQLFWLLYMKTDVLGIAVTIVAFATLLVLLALAIR